MVFSQHKKQRILVIKLGALGDMVQAIPFFRALQQKHPESELTLFTTPPFADWTARWGVFQNIWSESRFPAWSLHKLIKIWLKIGRFDQVIDLQGVDRTYAYCWGHKAYRISTDHDVHIRWRLQDLADRMGLGELPSMHLPVQAQTPTFNKPFALLIPGASKSEKCWPQNCFIELAEWMKKRFGLDIVVLGQETFIPELEVYKHTTNLDEIVALGSKACISIGNDTGPQLLAAAGGCPTLTFYAQHNPPSRGGPWGGWQLYSPRISDISIDEVKSLIEQHAPTWLPVSST